jgi:hypothetical protein
VSVVYIENRARVIEELRTMRERLPKNITLLAGGAGAVSLERELNAINVRLESSVSGLLSVLRHERILAKPDRAERVAS